MLPEENGTCSFSWRISSEFLKKFHFLAPFSSKQCSAWGSVAGIINYVMTAPSLFNEKFITVSPAEGCRETKTCCLSGRITILYWTETMPLTSLTNTSVYFRAASLSALASPMLSSNEGTCACSLTLSVHPMLLGSRKCISHIFIFLQESRIWPFNKCKTICIKTEGFANSAS